MTLDNPKPSDGDIGGFFILENVVNVEKSKMEVGRGSVFWGGFSLSWRFVFRDRVALCERK